MTGSGARTRRFALSVAMLLGPCLGGCGQQESADKAGETRNATVPSATVRDLPAAEQLNRAFATAFGGAGPVRRTVGEQTYVFRPERLEWVRDWAALISVGDNVEESHASGGAMAIHYLVPEGDGFRLSGAWPDAVIGGTLGAPPHDIAIRHDLTDYPVVYSEGGGTWQGYTCSWANLVELRPERPVVSESIPVFRSNAGAVVEETGRTLGGERASEVEGQIGNVRRNQGFDILFTGTERFAESYVLRGGRFVLDAAESRATC